LDFLPLRCSSIRDFPFLTAGASLVPILLLPKSLSGVDSTWGCSYSPPDRGILFLGPAVFLPRLPVKTILSITRWTGLLSHPPMIGDRRKLFDSDNVCSFLKRTVEFSLLPEGQRACFFFKLFFLLESSVRRPSCSFQSIHFLDVVFFFLFIPGIFRPKSPYRANLDSRNLVHPCVFFEELRFLAFFRSISFQFQLPVFPFNCANARFLSCVS